MNCRLILFSISLLIFSSCTAFFDVSKMGPTVAMIDIKVNLPLDTSNYHYSSWISIDSPQRQLPDLLDKDRIILPDTSIDLYIEYPLNHPVTFKLQSVNGFATQQIVQLISLKYHEVYDTERKTSKEREIPFDQRKGSANRNTTEGIYGIWGHDLSDLDLSGIEIHRRKDGRATLVLHVDS